MFLSWDYVIIIEKSLPGLQFIKVDRMRSLVPQFKWPDYILNRTICNEGILFESSRVIVRNFRAMAFSIVHFFQASYKSINLACLQLRNCHNTTHLKTSSCLQLCSMHRKWKYCTMYIVQLAYKKHTVLLLQSSPIDQYTLSFKVSAIAILIFLQKQRRWRKPYDNVMSFPSEQGKPLKKIAYGTMTGDRKTGYSYRWAIRDTGRIQCIPKPSLT
jgi:hypothetical protein